MCWWPSKIESGVRPGANLSSVTVWLPALSLCGWLLLAYYSRQPPPNFIGWLIVIIALQWTLTIIVWKRGVLGSGYRWLFWGVLFRVVGLCATPIFEDDYFRFLWDGRMFALTGNPYATSPSEHFGDTTVPLKFQEILDQVNNPHVKTIYGPLLQVGFLLSYLLAPGAILPWKILLLTADVGLLLLVRRLEKNVAQPRAALFAAWCPLSIFETTFNAHPDGLAVTLLTGALVAYRFQNGIRLGVWCGAAVATKIFGLLLVPFLLWRRGWAAWVTSAAIVAGCYLPFWLEGTTADLSGLRTFAGDWEFNSSIYALVALALDPSIARLLVGIAFGVGWSYLFYRWTRGRPTLTDLPPGTLVFGLFFILSPTFNPWYALWLLPFVALRPTPAGIAVLGAVTLSYITRQNLGESGLDGFGHPVWVRPLEFGLVALALMMWHRPSRRAPNLSKGD